MRRLLPLLVLGLLAPPLRADEARKAEPERIEIPYRLTAVKHILVRAKINNKGPFNFILDTGAPALFVATSVCDKLGIKEDRKGWGTFERFEIEGGLVLTKAQGRIETPFQLEGMNGLGLAGAELHGIIGYNILSQYRMEIDFTKDKMVWTKLDWMPKAPKGLGGKGAGQGGLEIFGSIMKLMGSFLGRKADPDVTTRAFLGLELGEDGEDAVVKSVLPGGPAAEAGLKAGDHFVKFKGRSVYGLDGLLRFTNKAVVGEPIKVIVKRGKTGEEIELTIKPGEGL
jgi:hypothetical protein